MMSYNVGVQCCRFCQRQMTARWARNHKCLCPVCGHPREEFDCGTPGVAAIDEGTYICYCPPALRLRLLNEALADLAKLIH